MRHVYVENEETLYSFTENSVVKMTDTKFELEQIRNNPAITWVKQNPIFYAGIALTNQCNCNCRYCLVETTNSLGKHTEWSVEDFSILLQGLTKQGLVKASITGGEPFTYPHLTDVFRLLSQYGIPANLNTNGTLLNYETVGQLIQCGLAEIDVSITDLEDDSNVYRDGINRARTRLRNLQGLVQHFKGKLLITASSVLTKKVLDNLSEMESILADIGIDRWRLREVLVTESNQASKFLYDDPKEFARKLLDFSAAEHQILVAGYLYEAIINRDGDYRCSNLEKNYVYVNYDKKIYWLARLSNESFATFTGHNIPQIAHSLHNDCYECTIPQRCIDCPASYFCLRSPDCLIEISPT